MPIIQSIINGQYTGGPAIQSAINHLRQFNAQQQISNRLGNAWSATQNAFSGGAQSAANQTNNLANAQQNLAKSTRASNFTFTHMLGIMLKFGVAMQIIHAITYPFEFLKKGVEDAIEFSYAMRQANNILDLAPDKFNQIKQDTLAAMGEFGITSKEITKSMTEIAHSMNAIRLDGVDRGTASLMILGESSWLARTAVMSQTEATDGLARAMNVLGLSISSTHEVAAIMFNTMRTGIVDGPQLAKAMDSITSSLGSVTQGMSDVQKLKFFSESSGMFAALTHVMEPTTAATSIRNLMTTFYKTSGQGAATRAEIKKAFGFDMSIEELRKKGIFGYMTELNHVISENGPLVQDIMKRTPALTNVQDKNARIVHIQAIAMGMLFGNQRTLRGQIALTSNGMQLYNAVMQQMVNSTNAYDNAIKQLSEETKFAFDQAKGSWEAFGIGLSSSSMPMITRALNIFHGAIQTVIKDADFNNMSFMGKISMLMSAISDKMFAWWINGGKEEWKTFWEEVGYQGGEFLIGVFGGGDSIMAEAGRTAAGTFAHGFLTAVKNLLTDPSKWGDILKSPVFQALLGWKLGGLRGAASFVGVGQTAQWLTGNSTPGKGDTQTQSQGIGFGDILNAGFSLWGIVQLVRSLRGLGTGGGISGGLANILFGKKGVGIPTTGTPTVPSASTNTWATKIGTAVKNFIFGTNATSTFKPNPNGFGPGKVVTTPGTANILSRTFYKAIGIGADLINYAVTAVTGFQFMSKLGVLKNVPLDAFKDFMFFFKNPWLKGFVQTVGGKVGVFGKLGAMAGEAVAAVGGLSVIIGSALAAIAGGIIGTIIYGTLRALGSWTHDG
jgi:hypothetical protein